MGVRGTVVVAALAAAVVAGACGSEEPERVTIDPADVVTLDFAGELAAADTDGWAQYVDGSPDDIYRTSAGGRGSEMLVGPATLTLDDGMVIDVAARTPGGNWCPPLDLWQQPPDPPPALQQGEACLVVGQYEPGSARAAWFSTLRVTRRTVTRASGEVTAYSMPHVALDPGRAIVQVGSDTYVSMPIVPDVAVDCFGMTFADILDDGLGVELAVELDAGVVHMGCLSQE